MKSKYLILCTVSAIILLLDQATKLFIDRSMGLHSSITLVENFFNITYIRNKGAAFGFLAETSFRLPFFILVSIIAVVVIIGVFRKLRPEQTFTATALSLIFAGALGNLIDRIRLGDHLRVPFPSGMEKEGTVFFRGVDADYATQRDVSRSKRDIKTFEVRLRVDNSDRRIWPGLTAYVVLPPQDVR